MKYIVLAALAFMSALTGCQASPATPKPMDSATLAQRLQSGSLPIGQVEIYTAETDLNKLLGRPNQYVTKVSWADTRLPDTSRLDATVEGFSTATDLQSRFTYTDTISKSGSVFAQYIYRNDKLLLLMRLPHELTPAQTKDYETWLAAL